jgi:DNA replication protein DnaC
MKRLDEVMNETGVDLSKAITPTTSSTKPGSSGGINTAAASAEGSGDRTQQAAEPCPYCGGLGYVRENVPVGHPNFGKLFPCRCQMAEIEQKRMETLRSLSNLKHLGHMTFDTFVTQSPDLLPDQSTSLQSAFEQALAYANDPKGWFVLLGGYGCGKTHLAAAISNHLVQHGRQVIFVAVPDLLDHLRATFSPESPVSFDEQFERVRNAPLLVLDDLGTESGTAWAQEKLFQIFNHRYNVHLPTIITSNQQLSEIDPRLRSRIEDLEHTTILIIRAPDYRRKDMLLTLSQDQSYLSSLDLMREMTFSSFDVRHDLPPNETTNLKRALATCRKYAAHPDGWLVLQGVYGCGKTHLAAAIANARIAQGEPAIFVVVPDLLDHLRATFSPTSQVRFDKRFDEVRTAPLLVLDDLGTESASPWAQEKLYQLFNYRYNARLPTIITMSQPIDDVDPRLRTRMLDVERCTVFGIIAPSYRGSPQRREQRKARSRG